MKLMNAIVPLCVMACAGSAGAIEVYKITYPGGVKTYTAVDFNMGRPVDASYPQLNPGGRIRDTRVCKEWDGGAALSPSNYQVRLAWRDEGDAESDTQTEAIFTAVATLPAADGYAVVFDYNMSTWDSYTDTACGTGSPVTSVRAGVGTGLGGGGDYWDLFTVNLNQSAPYWELVDGGAGTLGDPVITPDPDGVPVFAAGSSALPGATWAFGGACWGNSTLESALGRDVLEFEGDPTSEYYLSVTLDTANDNGSSDTSYPSWGIVNDLSKCRSDMNLDGVLDLADVNLFVDFYNDGSLVADFNKDGVLDFYDTSAFTTIFNDESENGCNRDCVEGLDLSVGTVGG